MEKENEIRYVTRSKLRSFRYHPYLVREDEDMANLVNSIRENGVIEPLIVRKITSKQYEILSGHRRFKACQILGLSDIPIIIKDIKMPEAAIFVVDSNLQRENLLPSEKAFAYKLKMEALYHRGDISYDELKKSPVETSYNTDSAKKIAQEEGTSRAQIFRFIRLTYLNKDLLDLVDKKVIAFRPAVELSYLNESQQEILFSIIEELGATPSLSQSQKIKKAAKEGTFDEYMLYDLLSEAKPNQREKLKIDMEELIDYFPRGTTPLEMKQWIEKLLKENEYEIDEKKIQKSHLKI